MQEYSIIDRVIKINRNYATHCIIKLLLIRSVFRAVTLAPRGGRGERTSCASYRLRHFDSASANSTSQRMFRSQLWGFCKTPVPSYTKNNYTGSKGSISIAGSVLTH